MKKNSNKYKKAIITIMVLGTILAITAITSFAAGIQDSIIFTGTMKMLNDAGTAVMILSPIAGGVAASICFARKSAADEQDGKMWDKRIKIAIISGAGGMLGSVIMKVVASYYGG